MMNNSDVSTDDIFNILAGTLTAEDIYRRRAAKKRAQAIGKLQLEYEEKYKDYTTRRLLAMRHTSFNRDYASEEDEIQHAASQYAVYKLLEGRPHIPSKTEGKAARRSAATAHHGPKKRGGRTFKVEGGYKLRRKGRA